MTHSQPPLTALQSRCCLTPQASAVAATTQLLQSSLPDTQRPQLHIHEACHSQLQALVGSNVASLVAFNLGYLPGGDKGVITRTDSTLAAVEAALEVCVQLCCVLQLLCHSLCVGLFQVCVGREPSALCMCGACWWLLTPA